MRKYYTLDEALGLSESYNTLRTRVDNLEITLKKGLLMNDLVNNKEAMDAAAAAIAAEADKLKAKEDKAKPQAEKPVQ